MIMIKQIQKKRIICILCIAAILAVQAFCLLAGCTGGSDDTDATENNVTDNSGGSTDENENENENEDENENENEIEGEGNLSESAVHTTGVTWTDSQALPVFSPPAEKMYAIHTGTLTSDERVTFSALQGLVNKTQPQILLTEDGDVPPNTWANTFGLKSVSSSKYEVAANFKDDIKGIVVYDTSKSVHYRNVASTIANINGYLPVVSTVKDSLSAYGVKFDDENIIDITNWTQTDPVDIYNALYEEYWQDCSKRVIISADPAHDLDHCRDIAAAIGAAVVYLDCTKAAEREVYEKFMKSMADNRADNNQTAIALGWFTTERSGVTAGSAYGISTIPANFYISGSVYSGISYNENPQDRTINIPPVPAKEDIENKVYIAVYMTDGDNIQYMQRFMRKLWDSTEEKNNRGKIPVNWTVSPSLADAGPGLLNYYYNLATDKECFIAGPSGMGYLMPINTNSERGVKLGDYLTDRSYMDSYTKLTETYLRKTGLRVVTIWDDANDELRQSFEENCPYLYGLTVHNFGRGNVSPGLVNNRLYFAKHETHYEGYYNTVLSDMTRKINAWDGNSPLFLSYQLKVWTNEDGSYCRTPQIIKLYETLNDKFDNNIEFVRADHFFALYNEANGLPFNLCMNEKTLVTSSDDESDSASAADGTPVTVWTGSNTGDKWLEFDFGGTFEITRYVISHAGETEWYGDEHNTRAFSLQVSENGTDWTTADTCENNGDSVTDISLGEAVTARYARLSITDGGADSVARIADIEIYGSVK